MSGISIDSDGGGSVVVNGVDVNRVRDLLLGKQVDESTVTPVEAEIAARVKRKADKMRTKGYQAKEVAAYARQAVIDAAQALKTQESPTK